MSARMSTRRPALCCGRSTRIADARSTVAASGGPRHSIALPEHLQRTARGVLQDRLIADSGATSLDQAVERFSTSERLFVAALSSLAGYVDAVGFVQSRGFFVSFMSGNSTRLGVGLAHSLPDALAAAGLVAAFILGVALGTLLGRRSERHRAPAVMSAGAAAWRSPLCAARSSTCSPPCP